MARELISIVVPVYGVEEFVGKCIDSLIAQTYREIEILLVDDGSPDRSGEICDEYALKDSRIKVFHIPNGGVAKARQLGVESSTGEYITFVDPDDWICENSVEVLYRNMSDDVDIVAGAYTNIHYEGETKVAPKPATVSDTLGKLLWEEIGHMTWAKIYRRKLFDSESFPNFKKAQDWLTCIDLSCKARATRFISDNVYYYFCRSTSTVNTFKTTIENELQFIAACRNILIRNSKYESHNFYFQHTIILCLYRVIQLGDRIRNKQKEVRVLLNEIDPSNLSPKYRKRYTILRSPLLQLFSVIFVRLKRVQCKRGQGLYFPSK